MSRLPIKTTDMEGSPFRKAFAANSPRLFEAFTHMEKALAEILEPEIMELLRLRAAANK